MHTRRIFLPGLKFIPLSSSIEPFLSLTALNVSLKGAEVEQEWARLYGPIEWAMGEQRAGAGRGRAAAHAGRLGLRALRHPQLQAPAGPETKHRLPLHLNPTQMREAILRVLGNEYQS